MPHEPHSPPPVGQFTTTHWSRVLAAGLSGLPESRRALEWLCEAYWQPLYAFSRRLGIRPDEAQDLTQAFFAQLLEKEYLKDADPGRGRFRNFLLAAFKHFLSKERDRARALKRGGDRTVLSLDFEAAENGLLPEPAHGLTPEREYERRWALTLLDRVLGSLQQEYAHRGQAGLFERLKEFLLPEGDPPPYAQLAAELNMTAGAVRVAVSRLRDRYGESIRAELAMLVADPDEVEDELRHLIEVVGSSK